MFEIPRNIECCFFLDQLFSIVLNFFGAFWVLQTPILAAYKEHALLLPKWEFEATMGLFLMATVNYICEMSFIVWKYSYTLQPRYNSRKAVSWSLGPSQFSTFLQTFKMSLANKNIVFDVVGTLFGYEHLFSTISDRLGPKLMRENIKPSFLGQLWIESAEREYTYLSMSGRYVPFATVVRQIFFRMLFKAGVERPRDFATEEDLDYIMREGYDKLQPREGTRECLRILRDAGFQVWALTAADKEGCAAYFEQAEIEFPKDRILSCDGNGVGKPDLNSYKPLLNQLDVKGIAPPWFAAAHAWDTSAAQRAGFKGAYCSVFEHEALTELFGEMDVIAETLVEMAGRVVAAT